jgi:hypothetical protein
MQMVVRGLAILLVAGGIIWILQGINVLPGSFMTGDPPDHVWSPQADSVMLIGRD